MARVNLTTIDKVIDTLGGVDAVARLTRRGSTAVHNWRAEGQFPASLYLKMVKRLHRRGFTAPHTLFRFERDMAA
jgi:hypothetical protein